MTGNFQWAEAYARLERVRRALDAGAARSPAEVNQVLRQRALALARPIGEAVTPRETLDLVVLSLASQRYGIETAHVREVVRLRGLTPVPCTPPFVLGIINHRGRILPILDLRPFLEVQGPRVVEGGSVVALEAGGMTFGIFADAVAGTRRVAPDELAPPPRTLGGARHGFIRSVTAEMIVVLDLVALAREPRILVHDEGHR